MASQRLSDSNLRASDYSILVIACLALFGVALVGGRYLTMHEAVLPQSAKEMYTSGEWIVPTSAGRPWLERPPLPQWITMAVAHLVGRFDEEWVVRLPAVIAATVIVLMIASLASFWYGRSMGLLSGLVLATTLEFTRYAWLAEQDIYLCALVTAAICLFARIEFRASTSSEVSPAPTFFGTRSALMLAWFVLLGMTNLAKGLVFGTAMALLPVGAFLLWNADWGRMRKYVWFWGMLVATGVALAWPIASWIRYPDVIELWHFDLFGRLSGAYTDINEPVWYYFANFPAITAPWFLPALGGLILTARQAFSHRYSPERFLWCWALVPMLVFTIPGGKHHHYMLHSVAPWAILATLGLARLRAWSLTWPAAIKTPVAGALFVGLPISLGLAWIGPSMKSGPDWMIPAVILTTVVVSALLAFGVHHAKDQVAAGSLIGLVMLVYAGGLTYTAAYLDECRQDTEFFLEARNIVSQEETPLIVNADLGSMDVFRILFYVGDNARPVHNLTFLRDESVSEPSVFVLTRAKDRSKLEALGNVRELARAELTRREATPGDRFSLFQLDFRVDLVRVPGTVRVSPMQAMDRAEGPFLGGRL